MFRCLKSLQTALFVILCAQGVNSQELNCRGLFFDKSTGSSGLDESTMNWIESRFFGENAKLDGELSQRVDGMLSPTLPGKAGKELLGQPAVEDEKQLMAKFRYMSYENIQSLKSSNTYQNIVAKILAKMNFHVVQNPDYADAFRTSYLRIKEKEGIAKNSDPHYLIFSKGDTKDGGRIFNHYMSKGDLRETLTGILRELNGVSKRYGIERQTNRVIVTLYENPFFAGKKFTLDDLRFYLRRETGDQENLQEVLVVHGTPKSGGVKIDRVFP